MALASFLAESEICSTNRILHLLDVFGVALGLSGSRERSQDGPLFSAITAVAERFSSSSVAADSGK